MFLMFLMFLVQEHVAWRFVRSRSFHASRSLHASQHYCFFCTRTKMQSLIRARLETILCFPEMREISEVQVQEGRAEAARTLVAAGARLHAKQVCSLRPQTLVAYTSSLRPHTLVAEGRIH
jgi:hypothetical protein